MSDFDLDDLAGELADFAPAKKKQATYTAREERVIAGFEDIERFYEEYGRLPQHGEGLDIFERLYAVRLDRLRELEDCRILLAPFDKHGLLDRNEAVAPEVEAFDPDGLMAELAGLGEGDDFTQLRHFISDEDKRAE
jgi:hypothetical protein